MTSSNYRPEGLATPCGGSCINWPAPDLNRIPCAFNWEREDYELWLPAINETAFVDFGSRWPGCCCYARIQLPASNWCAPGGHQLDLWPLLRYPAIEVVDYETAGAWSGKEAAQTKWQVWNGRHLVAADSLWPTVGIGAPDDPGTASVVVRYGAAPHPLALRARDEMLMQSLATHQPTAKGIGSIKWTENVVSLTENNRTLSFDTTKAPSLYGQVAHRFRLGGERYGMVDPATDPSAHRVGFGPRAIPLDSWEPAAEDLTAHGCLTLTAQLDAMFADAPEAPEDQGTVDPVTGQPV